MTKLSDNIIHEIVTDIRRGWAISNFYERKHGDYWIEATLTEEIQTIDGGDHYGGIWEKISEVVASTCIIEVTNDISGEHELEIEQQILSIFN